MRTLYLVFITITFSLSSFSEATELPYAQKILLNAEFDRAETNLIKQVSLYKDMRANVASGEKNFKEVRSSMETVYVFALESLYNKTEKNQFLLLARLLNDKTTRDEFYYPVVVKGGFSGDHIRYAAWRDEKCVNLKEKHEIRKGTIVDVEGGTFQRLDFGGRTLEFTNRYFPNKNKEQYADFTLVSFKIKEESPISAIIEELKNMSGDLAEYYSCSYIERFKNLENNNKKLHARYLQLAKLLNKKPKNFSEEKKENTVLEELNKLTTMPAQSKIPARAP